MANNTAAGDIFKKVEKRFKKLYSKRVFVHHYTEYITEYDFEEAIENVIDIKDTYYDLEGSEPVDFQFDKYERVF